LLTYRIYDGGKAKGRGGTDEVGANGVQKVVGGIG